MHDLLEVKDISKTFKAKAGDVTAVDNVNLSARKGEVTVIVGPSGSGKTTLLYLIGSLEEPDEGGIEVFGEDICLSGADLIQFRRKRVGFVFQFFNLITALTALENVTLPMDLADGSSRGQHERAVELLARMGIDGRLQKAKANKMSGGEKQRVAIARALANDPDIILADEPTGNLDTATGKVVVDILVELARRDGKCVIIVTHDESILEAADWAYHMQDGRLEGIDIKEGSSP
ncbi:MAG: ABC transporter ATP-binding protein [Actinobacteria bacterium]|jgi:ABC-type lipoprotein export system ATPase subunit|nr:MAG: ABC transporter ATP-binding protein [Actinomycetota bacterium]